MRMIKLPGFNSKAPEKHYRGFAHCHSSISYDGRYNYAELREIFIANDLDFVCITEHIEHLGQDRIDAIIDGCRAASDARFLFIPGIEMDEFVIYFIGIDHVKIDFSSSKSIFDSLISVSNMCVFSHPIKAKYQYPEWLIELCDAVEIWNTKHDGIHYPRKQSIQLLQEVKKIRPSAVPMAGMDFHNKNHLSPANIKLMNCGPLTEEFVLTEIKQGRFIICKNQQNTDSINSFSKELLWLRIAFMDIAHKIHLFLRNRGLIIPKPIKHQLRRLMEGK